MKNRRGCLPRTGICNFPVGFITTKKKTTPQTPKKTKKKPKKKKNPTKKNQNTKELELLRHGGYFDFGKMDGATWKSMGCIPRGGYGSKKKKDIYPGPAGERKRVLGRGKQSFISGATWLQISGGGGEVRSGKTRWGELLLFGHSWQKGSLIKTRELL